MAVCTCWRLNIDNTHQVGCVYAGMTSREVAELSMNRGLADVAAGRTQDLGDFTQYVED